jgi:hypothetical protein
VTGAAFFTAVLPCSIVNRKMRRLPLAVILAGLTFGLAAAAWWYLDKTAAQSRLAAFRVGQAASFAEAKREIEAIERQPEHEAALRELVSGWRTGNQAFDYYLAAYVSDRQSSEDLRRLFALELSWRPEVLADWAQYWSWRAKQSPDAEVASIADYLNTLASAEPPRRLTWREVLDLQAALTVTGRDDLAVRIGPDNWSQRAQTWRQTAPDFTRIHRPAMPLPDWRGAAPVLPSEP